MCRASCGRPRSCLAAFGERSLIVRPGLIVGPHDPTERFTYWIRRLAAGGPVLAPRASDQPVQLIDVRDLSEWIITMVERQAGGSYNATGPTPPSSRGMSCPCGSICTAIPTSPGSSTSTSAVPSPALEQQLLSAQT